MSKKFRVVVNEQEYMVSVEPVDEVQPQTESASPAEGGNGAAPSAAPETAVETPVPQQEPVTPDEDPESSSGRDVTLEGTPVEAPLRGNIMRVLVEEGQAVKEGEILLTLEAMKLENEITSPAAGIVNQILVREGDSVDPGDVLVTLGNDS